MLQTDVLGDLDTTLEKMLLLFDLKNYVNNITHTYIILNT